MFFRPDPPPPHYVSANPELVIYCNLLFYCRQPIRFIGILDSKAATAHKFNHIVDSKSLWLILFVWIESKNVCCCAKNKHGLQRTIK
jgi:hypothetical protein